MSSNVMLWYKTLSDGVMRIYRKFSVVSVGLIAHFTQKKKDLYKFTYKKDDHYDC